MNLKPTKAILTAIGTAITAVLANFTDDVLPVGSLGNVIASIITLVGTVYTVWRIPNEPKKVI